MNLKSISVLLSLILRHKPETIGIELNKHGWADASDLIEGINKLRKHQLDMDLLKEIVRTDAKQRYNFNDDFTKIRANQGHSIAVDVELIKIQPPNILYHGTGEKYTVNIDKQGLIPKQRLYVHLSIDIETAKMVGKRHGKEIIYQIDAAEMFRSGFDFFISENQVWLTKKVPTQYLQKMTIE